MDLSSVVKRAAKCSAFNPIEHVWSVLSNKLSNVTLSSKFEGKFKPLAMKSGVNNKERHTKEKLCLTKLFSTWNHTCKTKFNEFEIQVLPVVFR